MKVHHQLPPVLSNAVAKALVAADLKPGGPYPWPPGLRWEDSTAPPVALDEAYLALVSTSERRRRGQYYTPSWLVTAALDWIGWPTPGRTLVDPACGTGAFLVPAATRLAASLALQGVSPPAILEAVSGSIVGYDADPLALFLAEIKLACALAPLYRAAGSAPARWRLSRTDWLAERPCLPGGSELVGNPPWGAAVETAVRRGYRVEAESACLFVESALAALSPGASAVLVLPDIVLMKRYPRTRRLVLERSVVRRIALLGRPFAGVSMGAALVHLERADRCPANHHAEVWAATGDGGWRELEPVRQATFCSQPDHRFNVLLSDGAQRLLARFRSGTVPLGLLYRVHEGMHSGNVRSKLFVRSDPGRKGRRMLMRGDELGPFSVKWGGWHVRYDPGLIDRRRGEYAGLGREEDLGRPKVLIRRTGDRLVAAYDRDGLYPSNNFFYCLPLHPDAHRPELLVALFNSDLLSSYLRLVHPIAGRTFAEIKVNHLKALPVPAPGHARLGEVAEELLGLGASGPVVDRTRLEELARYVYGVSDAEAHELEWRSQAGLPKEACPGVYPVQSVL